MVDDLYKNRYKTGSSRLKGYDYSKNGIYFITIITKNRENYFGEIENGKINLSETGKIAFKYWQEIPNHFENIELDEFCIMPNHIHGIIKIDDTSRDAIYCVSDMDKDAMNRVYAGNGGITGKYNPMLKEYSIPKIIRWYKGRCSFEIRKSLDYYFEWQSRYYDNIIKDKDELKKIRSYIKNNPIKWNEDSENIINLSVDTR